MFEYDPYAPGFQLDPYPHYRGLREHAPVHFVEARNFWVLSRWDSVHDATSNPAYTVSFGVQVDPFPPDLDIFPPYFNSVSTIDPPEHTRLRRMVQKLFTPKAIRPWLNQIDGIADRLVDEMLEIARDDQADLVDHLARPLPLATIAELMRIPQGDLPMLSKLAYDAGVIAFAGVEAAGAEKVMAAMTAASELGSYFEQLVATRGHDGSDDIIGALMSVRDDDTGQGLTQFEVIGHALAVVLGGLETTSSLISNLGVALMSHPDQLDHLRERPEGVPGAIEETLRWDPPAQGTFRSTLAPVEIGEIQIPAGARVQLLWASANRDEARFPDGDGETFRLGREQPGHLSFAAGPHFCLGAALARAETRSAFDALLRKTTEIELRDEPCRNTELMPVIRTSTSVPVRMK